MGDEKRRSTKNPATNYFRNQLNINIQSSSKVLIPI